MANNLKKVNLNKRPLTIVFAVICGILMLLLVVPWCRKHSFGSTYYVSPLAFSMGQNFPGGLIAFVILIVDMFLLMSDFFVIDRKHRVVIRIVSVALLVACLLLTILVAIGANVPVND